MRRLWIGAVILAVALAAALVDREAGLGRWWRLSRDLERAEGRIAELRAEVERLEAEGTALGEDRFAQERAIREELELVRPGEIVVRQDPRGGTAAQRP